MLAHAQPEELDGGLHKGRPGAERLCAVTREVKPVGDLIRFVVGPQGVVPDLKRKLREELRGAGNLLGAEQSGHAQAVGFDLYLRWLEETVRALQGGDAGMAPAPPEVVLDAPARIPDAWVPDDDVKLDLYRRLARATSPGEIDELRSECRERFGPPPAEVDALFDLSRLRVLGAALGLQHVLVRGEEARLTFREGAVPRLAGLTQALEHVQLAAEVRRMVPLSLRLRRLGGEPLVPALVRALRAL